MSETEKKPQPAFFAPVNGHWIKEAENQLSLGKSKIYFYTSSRQVSKVSNLEIKKVYFKATGENKVIAKADFIELITENPREYRLPGSEDDTGTFYYGYCNLQYLKRPLSIDQLQRYPSNKFLRNDTPGCCLIEDPGLE